MTCRWSEGRRASKDEMSQGRPQRLGPRPSAGVVARVGALEGAVDGLPVDVKLSHHHLVPQETGWLRGTAHSHLHHRLAIRLHEAAGADGAPGKIRDLLGTDGSQPLGLLLAADLLGGLVRTHEEGSRGAIDERCIEAPPTATRKTQSLSQFHRFGDTGGPARDLQNETAGGAIAVDDDVVAADAGGRDPLIKRA
eukprot:3221015-Pyramimonas_sp.AAC.1